jgi:hypothetical protein
MINLEAKTGLTPEEVAGSLKKFFGKGGWGLELAEETPQCLTFEGGGGYVIATLCLDEGKTRINLVTQEWDYQVKEFVSSLSE